MRTIAGVVAIAVPGTAWSQPPPPAAVVESDSSLWLGPQLDLMPMGELTVSTSGNSASADMDTGLGLGGLVDFRVAPLVTVGFAPRLILGVKTENATDSESQLDLRARVAVGKEVAPRFRLHGIGTVGYSFIFDILNDLDTGERHTTQGLILGFGAGCGYLLRSNLQLTGELSYQLGWQSTEFREGVDVRVSDNYLTFGVGLLVAIN